MVLLAGAKFVPAVATPQSKRKMASNCLSSVFCVKMVLLAGAKFVAAVATPQSKGKIASNCYVVFLCQNGAPRS